MKKSKKEGGGEVADATNRKKSENTTENAKEKSVGTGMGGKRSVQMQFVAWQGGGGRPAKFRSLPGAARNGGGGSMGSKRMRPEVVKEGPKVPKPKESRRRENLKKWLDESAFPRPVKKKQKRKEKENGFFREYRGEITKEKAVFFYRTFSGGVTSHGAR